MFQDFFRRHKSKRRRYGDYVIVSMIAEGGMSHVYRGKHVRDGSIAAVKILKNDKLPDPSKLERLDRKSEGEIAVTLRHENVVRTYGYGSKGRERFIIMEYVEGRHLRELVINNAVGDHKRKLDILAQIGRGLEYVHDRGLVHRDFCPKNVLVDAQGTAKVIDFGLSILAHEDSEHLWERAGTAAYMAPELIRGNPGGPEADIYAFGVTMYEVLTGRRPFEGGGRQSKMQCHLNMEVPPPSQYNPDISGEIESLIMSCMSKNPAERPPSMVAVMNRLVLAERHEESRETRSARRLTMSNRAQEDVRERVQYGRIGSVASPS